MCTDPMDPQDPDIRLKYYWVEATQRYSDGPYKVHWRECLDCKRNAIKLASEIVSAYVASHPLSSDDLPTLITTVHGRLQSLGQPEPAAISRPSPPLPIRKTITPDAIISLEDGKPYKTLKRHLTVRGLTPQQYREKWGLPADYPMAAANYLAKRSELAKAIGLGAKRGREKADPTLAARPPAGTTTGGRRPARKPRHGG